jgi:NAD(P)H-hydrate repair Nnr-like enzyme with NAD(P)H-hydrate dehydratase domain
MGEAQGLADIFHLPMDDPSDLSLRLSRAYGVVTVLKGPDSYISDGDEVYAMREGTSVLAKAGTGDALAGVIGGLLAQGLDPVDACVLGTTIHARAGVAAAADLSSVSVCAEDVVRYLPSVCASIERERRSA